MTEPQATAAPTLDRPIAHTPDTALSRFPAGARHFSSRGVAALAMVSACFVAACQPEQSPTALEREHVTRVVRVVDGDTIEAEGGEHIRLVQVDTPEVHGTVECYGREASAFAESLVPPGTEIRVVPAQEPRDRYGRVLADVYRNPDALWVNAELLRAGYAQILTIPPNVEHVAEFLALQREARDAERGLWSPAACPDSVPSTTAAPGGGQTTAFADCDEARAAGDVPIYRGEPGYDPKLDGDGDGLACE